MNPDPKPRPPASPSAAPLDVPSLAATTDGAGSPRVLVVDDDTTLRESLARVLASEGYHALSAANGREALERIDLESVDLVLLDLNMPIENGWDTLQTLAHEHPLVPVVVVTGCPDQLFMAINAGVGALLEKPIEIPVLLKTITALLAETPAQRLARRVGIIDTIHYAAASLAR